MLAAERVREPVVNHLVESLRVAHPETEAGVLEEIGRVRHRLHAAGHCHVEVAGAHRLVDHARRAQAGGAHLVHGLRRDLLRDAGLDLSLARGDLALPGLKDLAVDDVLDLVGAHLGALERR